MNHQEEYTGEERRNTDRREEAGIVLRTIDATHKMIASHNTEEIERMRLLDKRIDDMNARLTAVVELMGKYMDTHNHVLDAFPNGDIEGHKAAHDAWIKETGRKAEFWRTMKLELAKWGLIGFCGWVIVQIWTGALRGPQG